MPTINKVVMALTNLPDPDVLLKWGRSIGKLSVWTWSWVSRRENRACHRLLIKLDLLVDNIWPYLSSGSGRADSLRSILDELFRNSKEEDQKTRSQILDRYRDLGEWLSFLYIHLKHVVVLKPTRGGLLDSVVEANAVLSRIEKVMDTLGLTASSIPLSEEGRKNYLRFRDTYNRFLTDYEAFCRDARTLFREIPEPAFKRLE